MNKIMIFPPNIILFWFTVWVSWAIVVLFLRINKNFDTYDAAHNIHEYQYTEYRFITSNTF